MLSTLASLLLGFMSVTELGHDSMITLDTAQVWSAREVDVPKVIMLLIGLSRTRQSTGRSWPSEPYGCYRDGTT